MNKKDIKDIMSIRLFVDDFYGKVRQDAVLGPIFDEAIQDNWGPHLEKMYAFWNAALFGVPGFRENPFAKHAPLKIGPVHFDRWLELFSKTIDENFLQIKRITKGSGYSGRLDEAIPCALEHRVV
ncbi:hypothetical protein GCM10027049_10760 [Mucilaginibacter puniceus]